MSFVPYGNDVYQAAGASRDLRFRTFFQTLSWSPPEGLQMSAIHALQEEIEGLKDYVATYIVPHYLCQRTEAASLSYFGDAVFFGKGI